MSLQVWLPLNGDLRNNGLANVTVTNNGATVNNNGKIGKCYSFDGIDDYLTIPVNFTNTMSFALWYKPSVDTNTLTVYHHIFDGRVNESGQEVLCLESPSFKAWGYHVSNNLPKNIWTHICAINNNGQVSIYINGELVGTGTTTMTSSYTGDLYISSRHTKQNFLAESMNDIRIYDHCLSEKEVKELAKGLVLHYKMDDGYVENTTNLITGLTAGGQTTISNGIVTTSGVNADTYFTINLSESITVGTQYTISCYADCEQNATFTFPLGWQGNTDLAWTLQTGYNSKTFIANEGSWGTNRLFMDDAGGTARSLGAKCKFWNFQLEKKDHATPYTPSSRNGNMVYDNSGYGYNGTISSSLSTSSDTAKYLGSTHFQGNSINSIHEVIPYADEITVCGFMKLDTDYILNNGLHLATINDNIFRICLSKDGHFVQAIMDYPTTSPDDWGSIAKDTDIVPNTWYHIAVTVNDTNVKIYIDGELDRSYNIVTPLNQLNLNSPLSIGSYSSELGNGNISDFRIYTTALSPEDIKELYETSASIDNNGNLYTRELVEV